MASVLGANVKVPCDQHQSTSNSGAKKSSNSVASVFASTKSAVAKESLKLILELVSTLDVMLPEYLPVERLGEGTFSVVYKAIETKTSKISCPKHLQKNHCNVDCAVKNAYSKCLKAPFDNVFFQRLLQNLDSTLKSSLSSEKDSTPLENGSTSSVLPPIKTPRQITRISKFNELLRSYILKPFCNCHGQKETKEKRLDNNNGIKGESHEGEINFVAIKFVNRTVNIPKLAEELEFLMSVRDCLNVISILGGKRLNEQIILTFPYFKHDDFREIMAEMNIPHIQTYMVQLFTALKNIHERRIIHRDVKQANFLYCTKTGEGMLVDFGLAESDNFSDDDGKPARFSIPDPELDDDMKRTIKMESNLPLGCFQNDPREAMRASRAGTRGYRAPEVLFKYPFQTCLIDVWSAGVIMLGLITRRFPIFQSNDDHDAIVEMAYIFGKEAMKDAANLYEREWICNINQVPEKGISVREFCMKLCQNASWDITKYPESMFDLAERCLDLNMWTRISAAEALDHEFFNHGHAT